MSPYEDVKILRFERRSFCQFDEVRPENHGIVKLVLNILMNVVHQKSDNPC